MLEHVRDPLGLIDEMVRATRPGGLIYLSFTNWYSPWGGHEMSPWHYLGPGYAERRYVRRHRREPKHECGVNLFPVHVGPVLRAMRSREDVEIVEARPRYYPRWCRLLVRLPGLRACGCAASAGQGGPSAGRSRPTLPEMAGAVIRRAAV